MRIFINKVLSQDTHCRLCNSIDLSNVIEFTPTPLEDQFITDKNLLQECYPLTLAICNNCGYVHLPHLVNPEVSYTNYIYKSSITTGLVSHFDDYALSAITEFNVNKGSLVVDLGSNDGSMLKAFMRLCLKTLGVEPAGNIASYANDNGVTTINDYFTDNVAKSILRTHGKAVIITANYMYANIDDINQFTRNVVSLLDNDGIYIVQTGYHPKQFDLNMFDYIYHEHFSYFTVNVLSNYFKNFDLEIIDVKIIKPKGGSIRVVAQKKGSKRNISPNVKSICDSEIKSGINTIKYYQIFNETIQRAKSILQKQLNELKCKNFKIVGFGASHSTTTLMYHFELNKFIDYIVDDNPDKLGTFSPGFHIPIYSIDKIIETKPDYILVLAWQHFESIYIKHCKSLQFEISWIVPLPNLNIINNNK